MADQNGENRESQIGRGALHRGSCHDSSYSEHQIEFEEICLPTKTRQDKGLRSKKNFAKNKEEGLVSLIKKICPGNRPGNSPQNNGQTLLACYHSQKKGKAYRKLIEAACQLNRLRNYFGLNLQSCSWSKAIALKFTQRFRSQTPKSQISGGIAWDQQSLGQEIKGRVLKTVKTTSTACMASCVEPHH